MAVIGCIAISGIFMVHYQHRQKLGHILQNEVDLVARNLRDVVEFTHDSKIHRRLIHSIGAAANVDLVVLASGRPLRVLASTRNDYIGLPLAQLGDVHARADLLAVVSANKPLIEYHADEHQLEAIYPVLLKSAKENNLGLVRGALLVRMSSVDREQEFIADVLIGTALIVASLVMACLAGYFLFRRRVLRPLGKITSVARRYQEGEATARVQLNNADEIGQLARTLDDFLDKLEARKARVIASARQFEENQTRLDLALEGGGLGLWDWDIASGFVHFDDRWCAQLGYSPEDLQPDTGTWERLVHPDDATALMRVLEGHLAGQISQYEHEHRLLAKTGEWKWMRECGQVLERDGQGRPLRMAGICQDITSRKQAEQSMQSARDAALEAGRLKSSFIANMSHEFRTPMNGVLGMLSLLGESELDTEQREYVEIAHHSGTALLDLINDILDFSKIEAGGLKLETIEFDARTLVEESMEIVAQRAHAKGLKLAALIPPEMPEWMAGDPTRLRQILMNLLSNAVKFTEKGEVTLRVRVVNMDAHNVILRFEVEDTGIGMSADSQRQLFQPFVQADGSITRRFGGTGLGLVICKQLVECMGGEIGVESQPGQGSRLWFTTHFARVDRSSEVAAAADLRDRRVLVLESHAATREALGQQLSAWGMRTDVCADSYSLLAKLRQASSEGQPYALALVEHHPLELNGMELIRQIRRAPEHRHTRLLLLTALGQRGDGQEAREAGAQGYLVKPVRRKALRDCLSAVMELDGNVTNTLITQHTASEKMAQVKYHVLVVDDTEINQKVAVRTLSQQGISADVASNGREALAALEQRRYDLILMDCHMPEMDGYQATARIRELPAERQGQIPIIAFTADVLQENVERCLGAGMNDYLSKPFKPRDLQDKLEHWLVRREPGEAPEETVSNAPVEPMETPLARDALDGKALAGLRELFDEIEFGELVEAYLRDMANNLSDVREAVAAGDCARLRGLFHKMKGASGNLAAKTLQGICQELEYRARDGQGCSPQEAEGLEAECARVKLALEQLAVISAPSQCKAA
jgi:PAS domain S-box-containing protein